MPLRVLVMISSLEGGGSERQVILLLEHLDRRFFAPELFVLRRGGSLEARLPADVPIHDFESAAPLGRTEKIRSYLPGGIHRQQVHFLTRLLRQREIDVIYDRTFHMSLIAGPSSRQTGIPRVSTIVSPPSHAVPLNAGRFLFWKRRRLRRAYRDAAAVLAVSETTARDAADYYALPRQRFEVIPNPVDSRSLDDLVRSHPRPGRGEGYTIACVGRMSAEKGQSDLILALDRLRSLDPAFPLPKVWMVGTGPMRESLELEVERLGLGDRFEFIGQVRQPEPWIAAADLVCVPSHFEGFPNVMLEAMALGVPVLARAIDVTRTLGRLSNDPTIRGRDYLMTFTGQGEAGVLELARKLRQVRLNLTATRSRMLAARRLVRETLSVDIILPRIQDRLSAAARPAGHKTN
jgi:glycosyltransferase involved in cell wall biosynthesis